MTIDPANQAAGWMFGDTKAGHNSNYRKKNILLFHCNALGMRVW
jgi:hypothetical protein